MVSFVCRAYIVDTFDAIISTCHMPRQENEINAAAAVKRGHAPEVKGPRAAPQAVPSRAKADGEDAAEDGKAAAADGEDAATDGETDADPSPVAECLPAAEFSSDSATMQDAQSQSQSGESAEPVPASAGAVESRGRAHGPSRRGGSRGRGRGRGRGRNSKPAAAQLATGRTAASGGSKKQHAGHTDDRSHKDGTSRSAATQGAALAGAKRAASHRQPAAPSRKKQRQLNPIVNVNNEVAGSQQQVLKSCSYA